MKKVIILCLLILTLSGCVNKKAETVVCSISDQGEELTDTLETKGDKIEVSTLVAVSDYTVEMAEEGYTEEDLEIIHELRKAKYANLDGVKYEYEIDGAIITETLKTDYSKTSFKELYKAELLDSPDADYISLKQTIKNYKTNGITCKTK
ncbi:MAG: DUF1307 domain-containing protein [Erysipelothrix sp.]